MEITQSTDNARPKATDPIYLENTLLRVFGVLFCHDPKHARARTGNIEINRGVGGRNITVRLDPEYAQPGPFAHKVAMAVIRKQSRFGTPAQQRISFSLRELMRLAGRKTWGGHDSEELAHALKQIRYTHILAQFKRGEHFVEHDFSIFSEVLIERRASPTDPIVACTIVVALPIIQSLNDKHFTCLNHVLMQELSSIAGAFYIRLFYHFATQYDGRNLNRVSFKKRYDDICLEWLGGIAVLKYRSAVMRDQIGDHLDQLVKVGFLESYTVRPAQVRQGFVITFRPGARFVSDYNTFYARRFRGDVQFKFHDENRTISEPHQVAYMFIEKRTGQKHDGIPYVSSKDVDTAKALLKAVPLARMDEFLSYALSEARKTNFDLQTLGGVRQYLNSYLLTAGRREAEKSSAATHRVQDNEVQMRADYDRYLSHAVEQLLHSLPAAEQSDIDHLARSKMQFSSDGAGFLAKVLLAFERARLLTNRYPDKVLSFDQWKVRCTQ